MAYTRFRARGVGQFTAPTSRSGKSYVYAGRRVKLAGPGFQLNWNGQQILADVLNAIQQAIGNLSDDALNYMQSIVPVDTGFLRDTCFVTLDATQGRIRLQIGANARYAVYVELGTRFNIAQPYIRPTFDYVISKLPGIIRQEVRARGRS